MCWANNRRITAVQRTYASFGEREDEEEEEENKEKQRKTEKSLPHGATIFSSFWCLVTMGSMLSKLKICIYIKVQIFYYVTKLKYFCDSTVRNKRLNLTVQN